MTPATQRVWQKNKKNKLENQNQGKKQEKTKIKQHANKRNKKKKKQFQKKNDKNWGNCRYFDVVFLGVCFFPCFFLFFLVTLPVEMFFWWFCFWLCFFLCVFSFFKVVLLISTRGHKHSIIWTIWIVAASVIRTANKPGIKPRFNSHIQFWVIGSPRTYTKDFKPKAN